MSLTSPPPRHILEAAKRALIQGATRYTSVRGIAPLRRAIARDSAARRGGIQHDETEIVVSVGAKHSLFNLCFALLGPGDEAIVPTPCWVSYPEQCQLAGARSQCWWRRVAEDGFKLTADAACARPSRRARGSCSCATPCNPTGAAYAASELAALAEVLREHPIWIVVDEIYAALVYGGFEQRSLLEVAPDLRERIIVVDGVSKRFAMTGFRIGWMLAPKRRGERLRRAAGADHHQPASGLAARCPGGAGGPARAASSRCAGVRAASRPGARAGWRHPGHLVPRRRRARSTR